MNILLNGESREITEGSSIAALLDSEGLGERRVAVEVNGEIIPRATHVSHPLQAGDKVEIVHALGGG
ncbi:MAG: sulfur carrier protein ThiS [Xanthomonadaceae bacterium]|nr:sulfur carrier protein ThiS [Xanthomonadaceae bacterium]